MDSRCPGMYLFEANAHNGISSSGMSDNITGITDETLYPPPDPKFSSNSNIDGAEIRSYPAGGFVLKLIVFYDNLFKKKFGGHDLSKSK